MKTKIIVVILMLAFLAAPCLIYGQSPQGIKYQAIARNNSGYLINNTPVHVKISVLGGPTGPVQYCEDQHVTTNEFGLFSLIIGAGNVQSGIFASIPWSNGNQYVKIEFDPNNGTSYIDMGTSQLLSVPYALYANEAGSENAGFSGGGLTNMVARWADSTTLGTGVIIDDSNTVAIYGSPDPSYRLYVNNDPGLGVGNFSASNCQVILAHDGSYALNANSTEYGAILGNTSNSNYTGVWGVNSEIAGIGNGSGVAGLTNQSLGVGVWGKNQNSSGTGIIGIGNNVAGSVVVGGSGGAMTGFQIGLYGKAQSNTSGTLRAGGYFQSGSDPDSYAFVGSVTTGDVNRKIEGNGTVNTVVKDTEGHSVVLSAPEAPENFFMDYGEGNLINGKAHIA